MALAQVPMFDSGYWDWSQRSVVICVAILTLFQILLHAHSFIFSYVVLYTCIIHKFWLVWFECTLYLRKLYSYLNNSYFDLFNQQRTFHIQVPMFDSGYWDWSQRSVVICVTILTLFQILLHAHSFIFSF
jgi:fumarate reductase subunit C